MCLCGFRFMRREVTPQRVVILFVYICIYDVCKCKQLTFIIMRINFGSTLLSWQTNKWMRLAFQQQCHWLLKVNRSNPFCNYRSLALLFTFTHSNGFTLNYDMIYMLSRNAHYVTFSRFKKCQKRTLCIDLKKRFFSHFGHTINKCMNV